MGRQMAGGCGWSVRAAGRDLCSLVGRFLVDDTGQDLIEYALLTATIGLASAAAWALIGPSIGTAYTNWNNNLYNLWKSPDPS